MITIGSFDSEIDAAPRTRIRCDVPDVPDAWLTATPGVRAIRISDTDETGDVSTICDAWTCATTAACARRSWRPAVPVTTTCSSAIAVGRSANSTVTVSPATTVTERVAPA
jgi:hypothetical protein